MGWVIFLKTLVGLEEQVRFSSITEDVVAGWSPRANSISVSEMLGDLVAIEWLAPRCRGRRIILMVDSECGEGALVKGASNAPDLADMVSAFWDILHRSRLGDLRGKSPYRFERHRGSFLEVEKRGGVCVDHTPPLWIMSGDAWQAELDRRVQKPASQSPSS